MSSHMTAVVCLTMASSGTIFLYLIWLGVLGRWEGTLLGAVPPFVGLLVALAPGAWRTIRSLKNGSQRSEEPEDLEKFVWSVRDIDRSWHEPFERFGQFLEQARYLFGNVTSEIGERYDSTDQPRCMRYKIASEITADSLRICDSILSQVRAGHPDTALGNVRQVLELSLAIKAVAIDTTGETAKRYRDCEEADYLEKSTNWRSSDDPLRQKATESLLDNIKREYGTLKFPGQYPWIVMPDGNTPRKMEEVIDYVVDNYHDYDPFKESKLREYNDLWEKLNKWAHISKSASRRKLGTRTSDGYLQKHLVEKSNVGLESPVSLSAMLGMDVLRTYAYIAYDVTGKEHKADFAKLDEITRRMDAALNGVDPNLMANDYRLAWRN